MEGGVDVSPPFLLISLRFLFSPTGKLTIDTVDLIGVPTILMFKFLFSCFLFVGSAIC